MAVAQLRALLPPTATLVGQSIGSDIDWLGLALGKAGTHIQDAIPTSLQDFAASLDLAEMFKTPNAKYPGSCWCLPWCITDLLRRCRHPLHASAHAPQSLWQRSGQPTVRCRTATHGLQTLQHNPVHDAKMSIELYHKHATLVRDPPAFKKLHKRLLASHRTDYLLLVA